MHGSMEMRNKVDLNPKSQVEDGNFQIRDCTETPDPNSLII